MCILFIYTNSKPQQGTYRLIIASNRDEFFRRPAKSASQCPNTNIIGGRDMEKGREDGMWLGVCASSNFFRFGALLNVTGEVRQPQAVGRGYIVRDYLKDKSRSTESYINSLLESSEPYNAYNFVSIELKDEKFHVQHTSNSPLSREDLKEEQLLAFGNSTLQSPLQKVVNGKERFSEIIAKLQHDGDESELVKQLLVLLKATERNLPDEELQRRSPDFYKELSTIYVDMVKAGYGTRTHSIVLVDYDWKLTFIEETMIENVNPRNAEWQRTSIKCML